MRFPLVIIFFSMSLIGCHTFKISNKKMRVLLERKSTIIDQKDLDNYKKYDHAAFDDSGVYVEIMDMDNSYKKIVKEDKMSVFSFRSVFFKQTLRLKSSGQYFYENPIGIWKAYDENGNVVKTIDFDSQYSISINDLCKIIFNKYHVDLTVKRERQYVFRGVVNAKSRYSIYIPLLESEKKSNKRGPFQYILVDGANGNIIKYDGNVSSIK